MLSSSCPCLLFYLKAHSSKSDLLNRQCSLILMGSSKAVDFHLFAFLRVQMLIQIHVAMIIKYYWLISETTYYFFIVLLVHYLCRFQM